MGRRYAQPDNEVAFEQCCLHFYRQYWDNKSLSFYAKRGEPQEGVDIHDPLSREPSLAVQCKHHEPHKPLPPKEIRGEVKKAEGSTLKFGRYIIATTARKSKAAHDEVVMLNRRKKKKFEVEIHFWDDICLHLCTYSIQIRDLILGEDTVGEVLSAYKDHPLFSGLQAAISKSEASTPEVSSGDRYGEIDALFTARNFEAARHALSKLPTGQQLKGLPNPEQYQILRLHGKLALEDGDYRRASDYFLNAYDADPSSDKAKQNRILAYSLVGKNDEAFRIGRRFLKDGHVTPDILTNLVNTASSLKQFKSILDTITPYLATDAGLNQALAHKYLQFDDLSNAEDAASRALAIAPKSPHTHFAVAMNAHNLALKGDRGRRKEYLQKALSHYDLADSEAKSQNYVPLRPEILVHRAVVQMLLGNPDAAGGDYRLAVEVATKKSIYAALAVSFFLHEANYIAAKELLHFVNLDTLEAKFQSIVVEYHTTNEETRKATLWKEMLVMSKRRWPRAIECRFHCLHWAIRAKDFKLAKKCFSKALLKSAPFQAHVANAWLAREEGNTDLARKHANGALELDSRGVHLQELRLLADVLISLKDDLFALPVLERISVPGVLDENTKQLILVAQRLKRHDLMLRICREVRESGQQDEVLRRAEVELLSIYAPEAAFDLCQTFITVSTTPWYFRAVRNWLAIRLGRSGDVDLDGDLPTPHQVKPKEAPYVMLPLVAAGKFMEAAVFLYGQVRHHFDDEQAHINFIGFFLRYGSRLGIPATMTAGPDTALQLTVNKNERWIIIEDDSPSPSRHELSSTSEIGKRVKGLKSGDSFELPGNEVQKETAFITAVTSKFVRLYADIFENFRTRFPEASFLQQLNVGSGDAFNPEPILESLRQKREHGEECVKFYREHPCSMYLFATGVGASVWEAMKSLATIPSGIIRCSSSTVAAYEKAVAAGLPAEANVVLDITAIATLSFVEGWALLDPRKTFLVSQSTRDLIQQWRLNAAEELGTEGGVMHATDDGRFEFHKFTPAQRQAKIDEFDNVLKQIDEYCECTSSLTTANVPPETRETMQQFAGFQSLDAICIAKERSALFWSDDLVLSSIATAEFGVRTTWSQLALHQMSKGNQGHLKEFETVTAKLAAWKYVNVVWNAGTIIRAGEIAEWDMGRWPFKQCIDQLQEMMPIATKAAIVAEAIVKLRRSSCSQLRQTPVIQALLGAVRSRVIAQHLLDTLDRIFPGDYPSRDFVRLELQYWLSAGISAD